MSSQPPEPSARRRSQLAWWLLPLLILAAGGYGWHLWQQHRAADVGTAAAAARIGTLEARLDALRSSQRANAQRLQQSEATNRVLRDELLGLGERAAIIEESFASYTDARRHGSQALRLDEAELLLSIGRQRLLLAGDLDGARRAYTLAAGVLAGVDDPAYLSLRQTLGQERAALEAAGPLPRTLALARLEQLVLEATAPPAEAPAVAAADAPWWRRAFGRIIQARPSAAELASQPADIAAARAGLQLEVTLARAAAERGDGPGFATALRRTGGWLQRLQPDPDAAARQRKELEAIAKLPLSPGFATFGTTLEQLRQSRALELESAE